MPHCNIGDGGNLSVLGLEIIAGRATPSSGVYCWVRKACTDFFSCWQLNDSCAFFIAIWADLGCRIKRPHPLLDSPELS